jgi:bifunctional DNA-binding transcriptional regulator/antitoxin component of YhaV-PrlF toxin-antitoxin module
LVTFKCFLLLLVVFWLLVVAVEEFVARVFKGGKVTVPKRLRELFDVNDDDYVRLALVEVVKKSGDRWVRKKV